MSPKPRKYNLPNNLTFDKRHNRYRYFNPITRVGTWFGRDRHKAIQRADTANATIAMLQAQRDLAKGMPPTVSNVIGLYVENVVPAKPWDNLTRKNHLFALNLYEREFGKRIFAGVDRIFLGDWLIHRCRTGDAYNKKRTRLIDLWKYGIARKFTDLNEAGATLPRSTSQKLEINRKVRKRLTTEAFWVIHEAAPPFLQVAMELSLVTLQARAECCNMRFEDYRDGWLYVIRDKTAADSDMAFIRIEETPQINRIIEKGRSDGVLSPYIVHCRPASLRPQHQQNKPHWSYVNPGYLTKTFKRVRDEIGVFDGLESRECPTFHEIRSLGGRIYRKLGFPKKYIQSLMTHTDESTTTIYLTNPEAVSEERFRIVKADLRLDKLPEV